MEHKREVTFAIKTLINHIRRLSNCNLRDSERITPMQGRVIGYLKEHSEQDVYQRDLEQEFQIRRSTASAILQTMERDDLIRREPAAHDARMKKLVLTVRAEAFSERFKREIERMEALVTKGVSPEELETFFGIIRKFEDNLTEYAASAGEPARQSCHREGKE